MTGGDNHVPATRPARPATSGTAGPHPRDGTPADHRSGSRRRGSALEHAIFEATLAALNESGYTHLTMERVATLARTSKAALYRRWPGRAELVVDTIRYALPGEDLPDTGSLRADVLALLRMTAQRLAGPAGEAARGIIGESLRDAAHTQLARQRMIDTHPDHMRVILGRAVRRGEARADALRPHVADAGPALLQRHFLIHGTPIADEVIVSIVDDIVLPLAGAAPVDGRISDKSSGTTEITQALSGAPEERERPGARRKSR